MPLSRIFEIPDTTLQVGIWHITEDIGTCLLLAEDHGIPIHELGFGHPERMRQFITSRLLLLQSFPGLEPVYQKHKSPPALKQENYRLSYSHTREYSCLVLSNQQAVGIDMESDREKIFRIHSRFCGAEEVRYAGKHNGFTKEIICILWCIKEAVFKKYHHLGLNFKEQIFVPEFLPDKDAFIIPVIIIDGENTYTEKCHIEKIFNHWLAVV